ncbi:MAG: c-type cytochrome [Bordetella sp.]|uniref:cytochrome c n=1 Tax=Bordetella sp. TaxID=28081 RepID=UPI003F7BEC91
MALQDSGSHDTRPALAAEHARTQPAMPDGVLHGLPLRPPSLHWDGQRYTGALLQAFDAPAAQTLPGVVAVMQRGHYIGVVAVTAGLARQAVDSARPVWQRSAVQADGNGAPGLSSSRSAESGARSYVWQLPARAADAGVAVTAWCLGDRVCVWAPCPAPRGQAVMRAELSRLLGLDIELVQVIGGNTDSPPGAHALDVLDAAADAALLSQCVQRPVRVPVQGWAAPGELALQPGAMPDAFDARPSTHAASSATAPGVLLSAVPWAVRPSLARLLSTPAQAEPSEQPTAQGAMDIVAARHAMPAPLPHAGAADFDAARVFAEESARDEEAVQQGSDPLAHRLNRLPPGPARQLAERMAERAGWRAVTGAQGQALAPRRGADERLHGRGYASAHLRETHADGTAADRWSAWIAEVAVEPATGRIDVTRVVVGHDSRDLRPAQGATIRTQDPRLLDAARRLLAAPASFDDWGIDGSGAAPAQEKAERALSASTTPEALAQADTRTPSATAPPIDHGQLVADGVLTLPAAAAIANAVFDATGVRLRQVPFDGEQLRLALTATQASAAPVRSGWRRLYRSGAWLAAGAGAIAGLLAMAWPAKPAIAPTEGPDISLYSAAAVARGRLVAAAGDCAACHTAPHGAANIGGFALQTPFGTVYSTNITPDKDTGIGRWSYGAFERAMREGVHRDGRQLYPAFPYTAFAKMTDADMQALYAYLMSQPPVRSDPPTTRLAFPFNLRPAIAGWNLLFHDNRVYRPDPAQSLEWNRGAYLVEGMGHCGACHTPRNALGAEKTGLENYLAGGEAEGWKAPPLNGLGSAKVPWTGDDLFRYLRTGYSARHGVAAGPMAPVIHGLAQLPESDVRAIATYLLDLPGRAQPRQSVAAASSPLAVSAALPTVTTATPATRSSDDALMLRHLDGERLYQNACAACHEAGHGPTLFGVKPLLAANTSVHAGTPDNLIQVILNGIQAPANGDLGYMPGFKNSLDDSQVADLLGYLRARFAPGEPQWADSRAAIERVRAQAPD